MTSFQARVKKIEINNRVLTDGCTQSIRVVLEDIELSNENLAKLRQFKPNELVNVEISPVQINMFGQIEIPLNYSEEE